MGYDYDRLYRSTREALGAPTRVFVDFFARQAGGRLRVLDVGCGQGRDALFIGRAGHSVLGIDLAPCGIRDLDAAARAEGLDVLGIVADITRDLPEERFDVVLADRTLHMLGDAVRPVVLGKLLDQVVPGGWCLIADEPRNIAGFRRVAAGRGAAWQVETARKGHLFLRRLPS
ncbi:class I SAM-dependent methyltransferase [Maliponia aquimaris]|uniref:Putative S-adenosyl-L-methionine-dependent methyltransferase TehB n=1 Tax=Maliponia aquimaris TaxID=1673631 RepID=A0A238JSY7_9RHOB|nr:class I SAM-dependent methyltransferase [Maliponia aquimaris]SMX33287.1 putative S-adenosyl-L-methionine-dependent methyltransferase TehB [Maliponia aquimaris]